MYNEFKGKTYLVTGANSGIGKSVSLSLLKEGARLFLVDRDIDYIQSLATESDRQVNYLQFDLNKSSEVELIFKSAKDYCCVFDGMVYCAGISPLMTLKEFDLKVFQTTYNINVVSFVAMLKFFMDEKYTNEGCSIVGVSSSTSIYGGNRQYAYSSSKAAMNLVMKSCVKELAQRKTRINTIMPSITNSEMVSRLRKQSDAIDINVKYKMPFGILEPHDVSKAIMYLLSEYSSAISGIQMPVNNGEIY